MHIICIYWETFAEQIRVKSSFFSNEKANIKKVQKIVIAKITLLFAVTSTYTHSSSHNHNIQFIYAYIIKCFQVLIFLCILLPFFNDCITFRCLVMSNYTTFHLGSFKKFFLQFQIYSCKYQLCHNNSTFNGLFLWDNFQRRSAGYGHIYALTFEIQIHKKIASVWQQ